MEKLSPNRAQLFLRNKYTAFTIGGTVAIRSVNIFFPESYSSAATTLQKKSLNYFYIYYISTGLSILQHFLSIKNYCSLDSRNGLSVEQGNLFI